MANLSNAMKFVLKHGTPKTKVKTADGISVTLDGIPAKYTATEMVKLAKKTFKTRVSLPKGTIDNTELAEKGGIAPRNTFTGNEVQQFIEVVCNVAEADGDAPDAGDTPKAEGEAA